MPREQKLRSVAFDECRSRHPRPLRLERAPPKELIWLPVPHVRSRTSLGRDGLLCLIYQVLWGGLLRIAPGGRASFCQNLSGLTDSEVRSLASRVARVFERKPLASPIVRDPTFKEILFKVDPF